ncbi:PTS system D-fructose-specific IIA component (F1P-forming) (Frc family) /PTS system D-fructose-specific IIB component (F1P-forming) (Frc family) /PTS system D-fructose-specific IIC component (F1P-forming) (Frc family) [Hungatella effluvii]|uniref:PTS system D-fructose-specific IIA component (F1P-forming) (Frc family) /PTS system D-fructose-specific IIB component (F1P-forming) (Frc family) /PTS system D-fructose-specific IIC component (F1P-f... n=1 Tax=Hungatella effluvii TaxID=1096246 RepID=A0A2V3Y2G0_9FIRM|nr:fructose-specific PTS transporter subunit EIIC [Hungatella effluvii]PXX50812.1 PTS system D-fructose-specific IIA component (F1P-forming) (Frc family) /PTS system D-fructose-specific IIB component (F1P-forming) (Frc family) /PTS system D-fructose-specific IIC component (F1P-forming) (Frc family) [Hungatella effluvii]
MRITELLKKESIELGVKVSGKEEAIDKLIGLMAAGGRLNDKAGYKEGILAREALGSTAVGEGIAIPHAKVAAVKEPGLAAMVVPDGVDYEAFDGSLANLIFMIAAPEGEADVHLEALSRLSTLLMDPDFKNDLIHAESKEEFLQLIDDKESERYEKKVRKEEKIAEDAAPEVQEPLKSAAGYRVLAVTACPTGIAHTFMAAENLEQLGKKLGIPVKSETNGAEGAANVLTKEEIAAADGIIIAADKNVDMARFDGKHVVKASVSDGIQKGEELIKKAVSGEAPVYHHTGAAASAEGGESEGIGHTIYKHLMNGVSHMLPFVIGGGLLIALAFLFDDYSINPANFGKNTPIAAYLKTIGEQAFGMMLPVLAGYIAMSIADRPGLAVGFVGGMVAKMGATFMNPAGGDVNSGFLGALLAGFIGGYIVVLLKKVLKKLPKSLEGIKPVLLYPLLGIFLVAVATTFINPFVGAINDGLTHFLNGMGGTSKVILGAVVGGMMSVDMGGPVNKAAYVFGTAQLAEGNFDIMAAVMAGGMVPPIAIALCSTFFKKKFTEKERQSGLVNYIMGLSFISEGAIPFAASDPLRVIPSCIIGSAVAGGLSMALNCTLRAPHGGIFVLPTIGNPFGYLAAVVIGSVIGCVILAALKKNKVGEE